MYFSFQFLNSYSTIPNYSKGQLDQKLYYYCFSVTLIKISQLSLASIRTKKKKIKNSRSHDGSFVPPIPLLTNVVPFATVRAVLPTSLCSAVTPNNGLESHVVAPTYRLGKYLITSTDTSWWAHKVVIYFQSDRFLNSFTRLKSPYRKMFALREAWGHEGQLPMTLLFALVWL